MSQYLSYMRYLISLKETILQNKHIRAAVTIIKKIKMTIFSPIWMLIHVLNNFSHTNRVIMLILYLTWSIRIIFRANFTAFVFYIIKKWCSFSEKDQLSTSKWTENFQLFDIKKKLTYLSLKPQEGNLRENIFLHFLCTELKRLYKATKKE